MVVVFGVLSFLSYCIPKDAVLDNALISLQIVKKDKEQPPTSRLLFWEKDSFTDGLMLNEAFSGLDSQDPLQESLKNPFYIYHEECGHIAGGILAATGKSDQVGTIYYGRYWHGYVVPLRIALCFLDITGIRIINCVLLWGLSFLLCWYVYKRISFITAIVMILGLAIVGMFTVIPYCMQFSTCFYIMLIGSLMLFVFPSLSSSINKRIIFFFIIGGVTSYFDFLTTPIITIAIPLALVLMINEDKRKIKMIVLLSLSWIAGYGGIWAAKWILATAITDINIIADAVDSIQYRTFTYTAFMKPRGVLLLSMCLVVVVLTGIMIACWLYMKRGNSGLAKNAYLLVIGYFPIIWFLTLQNHSYVHNWFVWRGLFVTFFCWGSIMMNLLLNRSSYKQCIKENI